MLAAWLTASKSVWTDVDALEVAAAVAIEPERVRALELCQRWDVLAAGLGGSPSDFDWTRFRPLRLGREEDWSDWLAFLLETGPGSLPRRFLGIQGGAVKPQREYQAGAYRADIVLDVAGMLVSMEVKLDDPHLEKTFACCASLERTWPASWRHFILLPEERVDEWTLLSHQRPSELPDVSVRSWTDLAVALRRCLARGEGTVPWRCWALAYCGAVEQRVMGLPSVPELRAGCSFSHLGRVSRLCEHLEAVMEASDGDAN